jgi:hypothetical protein
VQPHACARLIAPNPLACRKAFISRLSVNALVLNPELCVICAGPAGYHKASSVHWETLLNADARMVLAGPGGEVDKVVTLFSLLWTDGGGQGNPYMAVSLYWVSPLQRVGSTLEREIFMGTDNELAVRFLLNHLTFRPLLSCIRHLILLCSNAPKLLCRDLMVIRDSTSSRSTSLHFGWTCLQTTPTPCHPREPYSVTRFCPLAVHKMNSRTRRCDLCNITC